MDWNPTASHHHLQRYFEMHSNQMLKRRKCTFPSSMSVNSLWKLPLAASFLWTHSWSISSVLVIPADKVTLKVNKPLFSVTIKQKRKKQLQLFLHIQSKSCSSVYLIPDQFNPEWSLRVRKHQSVWVRERHELGHINQTFVSLVLHTHFIRVYVLCMDGYGWLL